MSAGARIIASIKDAIDGKFARVTIDGETWVKIERKHSRNAR